jgi:hypothetical protein
MAAPEVRLTAAYSNDDQAWVVAVECECGELLELGERPTLQEVLIAIGEHNYEKHLRPDNVGLRVRR